VKVTTDDNEQIVCADGFTLNVQASSRHYCEPHVDNATRYRTVEVRCQKKEALLAPYCACGKGDMEYPIQCHTVYTFVPVDRVTLVIAKHGGIVSGELPPGIPYLRATS